MTSPEVDAVQAQINAARLQTHANIAVSQGWAGLARDASVAAGEARDVADGHADRAERAANEFGLSATASTGAAGTQAAVTVSGDGPAYSLSFTVPQGIKGDTGTTEWSGINGKPATFPPTVGTTGTTAKAGDYQPTWEQVTGKPSTFPPATHSHADKADLVGGLVPTSQLPAIALTKPFPVADRAGMLALIAQEGDVAVITAGADKGTYMLGAGASTAFASWVKLTVPDAPVQSVNSQTGTVNLSAADVGARASSWVPSWGEVSGKPTVFAPATHTHPVSDVSATGTASATTFLRGDGAWQTPTNTTYAVPSQAEAEAGTATTARAFSAQRAHEAAIAASGKKDWQGTQAQYDALGTKDADRTYWIV